jgi:hypothetical protein
MLDRSGLHAAPVPRRDDEPGLVPLVPLVPLGLLATTVERG